MKPTHQFTDAPQYQVTAWQYDRQAARPVWVCRKFHNLDRGPKLTCIARNGGLVTVLEGDWIVATDPLTAVVLSPDEFNRCFTPLL